MLLASKFTTLRTASHALRDVRATFGVLGLDGNWLVSDVSRIIPVGLNIFDLLRKPQLPVSENPLPWLNMREASAVYFVRREASQH